MIEKLEARLISYLAAKHLEALTQIIHDIGLNKKEWDKIKAKKYGPWNALSRAEISEIELALIV